MNNKEFTFPDAFLFLMEYFSDSITPLEAHEMAGRITKLIIEYHGALIHLTTAHRFDVCHLKQMSQEEKHLTEKIMRVMYGGR